MDVAEHSGHSTVERPGAAEDAGQRVVLALGERIELVVVAASAADRDAQERASERVELVVDNVHLQLRLVLVHQSPGPDCEEARGDCLLASLQVVPSVEHVARDLLADEPVVRLVAVERVDHVVPVAPRVERWDASAQPEGVRVSRQVQPVPAPPLSERRRRQEPVHRGRQGLL